MADYYIGEIFVDTYPSEAVDWCDTNNCGMVQIENDIHGLRQFQIQENAEPTDEDRQRAFESTFIETSWGWYRKNPKGYSNAPQSIDIIDNMVSKLNGFSTQIDEMMIFYQKPDFSDASQCTEEWLVAHQYHHGPCTKQEFDIFYMDFQTRWALDQYKSTIDN